MNYLLVLKVFNQNYFLTSISRLKIRKTEDTNPGFKLPPTSNYTNLLLALQLKEINVIPKIGYYSFNTDVLDPLMPFWIQK